MINHLDFFNYPIRKVNICLPVAIHLSNDSTSNTDIPRGIKPNALVSVLVSLFFKGKLFVLTQPHTGFYPGRSPHIDITC